MYDRIQEFTKDQIGLLHEASMDLLSTTGVAFFEDEALEIFKANGFKVDGKTVFFTEAQVAKALETAPGSFTVHGRNPEAAVRVGGDDFTLAPGYGAPFVHTADGTQRPATLADYRDFCKLIQTSDQIDMNGFMMVEPHDVAAETAHLDMLLAGILLSDKPFMGSPVSGRACRDCVEMLKLIFGEAATEKTYTVSLCNSLSPLQFSDEMAASIIELARANQATVIASLIMAGSSGPVTLSGVIALQNAEILAGITLAQLVRPGAPVVYGSTSSAMDMRTGGLSIGAPELSVNISATAQMAHFYGLPSRSGGGLTDAMFPDAQAGAESMLALSTAIRGGVNFILHTAGIVGAYIAMSFEKFLIDEECCAMLRKLIKPLEISPESIDLEMIKSVGIGGQYLTQPKTFQLCRTEFFMPGLMSRDNYAGWAAGGRSRIDQTATAKLQQRLEAYSRPDIDPGLESDLEKFVDQRK